MITEIVARLSSNVYQQKKLSKLVNLSSRLWNEANYDRRKQFFKIKILLRIFKFKVLSLIIAVGPSH